MRIRYTVRSHGLLGDRERHAAMVRPVGTAELEDVIARMAFEGGSEPAIVGVLTHFFSTIEALLREGYNVNTPIANYHLSITGSFGSSIEPFDPRKHRVVVRITAGKRLRRLLRGEPVYTERVEGGPPVPYPRTYIDTSSGERNGTLTPGGVGRLLGSHLRFDVLDSRQGVFFVGADGRAYSAGQYAENTNRQLIFVVPDLPPGNYTLHVRAAADDSSVVRAGRLDEPLTVGLF